MVAEAQAQNDNLVQWPPIEANARLANYDRNRALYESRHPDVFTGPGGYATASGRPLLTVNMCTAISDLVADRLFGEDIALIGPDDAAQAWLEHIAQVSNFDAMLTELATGTSYRGDGLLKIRYDATTRQVLIEARSPSILFPETDEAGKMTRAILGWILNTLTPAPSPTGRGATAGGAEATKYAFLRQEIHTPGKIENVLYGVKWGERGAWEYDPARDRLELTSIPETAELEDEQATGIQDIPLVPIAINRADEAGMWGISDYADIESLQGELNNRYTQRAEILDKHSDPGMYGPPGLVDADGKYIGSGKYVQVGAGEEKPGYLQWNAQLAAVENEIADLKLTILLVAKLSPESFGLGDTGGAPESGTALRLKERRTGSRIRRLQKPYGSALQRAISIASQLSLAMGAAQIDYKGQIPDLTPEQITLGWQDGLPNDTSQQTTDEVMAVTAGISSRKSAIQRLYGLDEVEAEAELQQIDAERAANAPAAGTFRLGAAPEAVIGGPMAE